MTLHGDLVFLPLAWYALVSHCRLHRIRREASRPALEIYHQDPAETTVDDVPASTLYLPIKHRPG